MKYTKWQYYPLAADNLKAKKQVLENLEMGVLCKHTLCKKLLQRFSESSGDMLLIAFESLDLDADWLYKYATYCDGKSRPSNSESITWMDSPLWGLISFVDKHLLKSNEAVVLCENLFADRKIVTVSPKESRLLFFKDEVYHILTKENAGRPESIECAIRESEYQWATSVCSSCAEVPLGDIPSEAFFDAIVANTTHIFVPALDGEGYLVWCLCPENLGSVPNLEISVEN
ncbi:MAG: hypothetical protein LBT46_02025 [Planctomycetaceae bacterium]|jgi:hypothetical protein|nr:hypothetical protein [Planctomycetaceae bacterium]